MTDKKLKILAIIGAMIAGGLAISLLSLAPQAANAVFDTLIG
jgi:hypothetical protein